MGDILVITFILFILNNIPLKFILNGPIDDKSALVEIVACQRIGDKPLLELMLIQFADTYIPH